MTTLGKLVPPGEYSQFGSIVGTAHPEPVRFDPKADRITLKAYQKETGWTVEQVDFAIGTYNHPKPVGRVALSLGGHGAGSSEVIYSRSAIAAWREKVVADLRRLGLVK